MASITGKERLAYGIANIIIGGYAGASVKYLTQEACNLYNVCRSYDKKLTREKIEQISRIVAGCSFFLFVVGSMFCVKKPIIIPLKLKQLDQSLSQLFAQVQEQNERLKELSQLVESLR